ncbi:lysophospholipid acyltransferase family protein [Silicimonas sp. MF1-12-2]|uniref:lysophospholipid acyltransferase family protein n=1 Tax=Silicimonas sp. MF1-12-2 TaxID=3384793 RepID=UPI0039B63F2F
MFIGVALLLPYGLRVRFIGWLVSTVVAPFSGWKLRVHENLALVMPEVPEHEVRRIARRVCNNVGRALIEIYSGEEFLRHSASTKFEGPGVAALEAAKADARPMVLITAHLGNYDVVRGILSRQGLNIAALYKPMSNKAFNRRYVEAISAIAEPVFPLGRAGVSNLVRHLKSGGCVGIVADVANTNAPVLSFFGKPAHTPLSAAEWAVKYDALLVPVFALRDIDGLHFRIHVAEPIPHGEPEAMMQAYNDIVEELVRENMDQWFWIHRRWKLPPAAQDPLTSDSLGT